jgi:hypothetical protein
VTISGATPATDPATATVDFTEDSTDTGNIAHVEWDSGGTTPGCSAGQYEFVTWELDPSANPVNSLTDQGFSFVIP